MALGQKNRSLHCGLQAGLNIKILDGYEVILLCDVPFELEDIIAKWLAALQEDRRREYIYKGRALTIDGWSAFVLWMIHTLQAAQEIQDRGEEHTDDNAGR